MTPSPELLLDELHALAHATGPVRLMEICGTHTVALFRSGIRSMLPLDVEMLSGPGCPVCVTAQGYIDAAAALADRPDVIVCSYGDMLRVPGRGGSLEARRAAGGAVEVVYSARDAVKLAARWPERTVVFLGVGFETTAPATAAAIHEAARLGLDNFTVLLAHKLVVPAMMALLSAGDAAIDGFLCPGHVSVIIGADAYQPIVQRFAKPCVVAGFEPPSLLEGLTALLRQIAAGECLLENVYPVAVTGPGNIVAQQLIEDTFAIGPAVWRSLGSIANSGLTLRPAFERFDAAIRFGVCGDADEEAPGCRCGSVLQGKIKPAECPMFGTACTPRRPVGPCMVSSEGTCAAWYKYRRPAMAG